MSVRAKFRCISVTHTWDEVTTFCFRPVFAHNGEGASEENKRFWKATPNGSLELVFAEPPVPSYRPGSYYYLDLREVETERPWTVYSVERIHEGQTNVCLHPAWHTHGSPRTGTLRLGLDVVSAYDWFTPGARWSLELTLVPEAPQVPPGP